MLLGTHPIPARSPAEREGGQNGKETRREGDRGGLKEAGTRRRDGGFMGGETGSGGWNSLGRRQRKSRGH